VRIDCPACSLPFTLHHASVCGYWHASPPLTNAEKVIVRAGGKIREAAAAEAHERAYGQGWRRRARCV